MGGVDAVGGKTSVGCHGEGGLDHLFLQVFSAVGVLDFHRGADYEVGVLLGLRGVFF